MNPIDEAVTLFENGYACSQAVLMAFSGYLELDRTQAQGIAAGFGSGMRAGHTCGTLTGAIMVLGLALADTWSEKSRQKVNTAVNELRDRFSALHGTDQCSALLGCNPATPAGRMQAVDQGLFRTLCPVFVRDAARLTAEILADYGIDTTEH